jgi:acetylornithine deacetylase/succinyl-diaminopimelate desuccinylase-like protein
MESYIKRIPQICHQVGELADSIIANIVLVGQIPAPTFHEENRSKFVNERLCEFQIDECTEDGYGNPIGIIHGSSRSKPPIFVVAHMDTPFGKDVDHNFTIKQNTISGAGLIDNSLGLGVLLSLPEILRHLKIELASDLVLAGVIQSIGHGNLRGVRHLLKTWPTPIRGAVCIESGELGRLNYYTDGMIRCEVHCEVNGSDDKWRRFRPNAIVVLNDVINQIMELRLPLKPRAKIVLGTIEGGLKHGTIAHKAKLGFEIQSDSDDMVSGLYLDIQDIIRGVGHENKVDLTLTTISNVRAARLHFNHPLVKSAATIMEALDLNIHSEPSESELSIFLSRQIPALTLGVTHGVGYQKTEAIVQIDPIFKGIAQIIGVILAIDSGVCDETPMD